LSVLLVCSYPSGFGFTCWRNYSVRKQFVTKFYLNISESKMR
jgi:hypothetical protein